MKQCSYQPGYNGATDRNQHAPQAAPNPDAFPGQDRRPYLDEIEPRDLSHLCERP